MQCCSNVKVLLNSIIFWKKTEKLLCFFVLSPTEFGIAPHLVHKKKSIRLKINFIYLVLFLLKNILTYICGHTM